MIQDSKFLDMCVLDSLVNDIESVGGILRMLNSDTDLGWVREWGSEFMRVDVVTALTRLVCDELVRAVELQKNDGSLTELPLGFIPASSYDDWYFAVTPRGRMVHDGWNPTLP